MNAQPAEMTQEEFQLLNEFLSEHFGLYFPETKKGILESRLTRRIYTLNLRNYMDYYYFLQFNTNGSDELSQFSSIVTNNETYFFRETHQFEALLKEGVRKLKALDPSRKTLRILCAGCSTGEEPYTLNIFTKEYQFKTMGYSVEIDAFDLDVRCIDQALSAEYGTRSLRSLSNDQISRYFTRPRDGRYFLRTFYRTGINFFSGNILDVNSYMKSSCYDALFCRNVLIYFNELTLRKAIQNFARCLRPGGLLFLGHSESIIGISSFFETIRFSDCIAYRRVNL
jgi:chemotaxis protein methyltransferase CheR